MLRLQALFRKDRVEQELDDELRFHVEKQIEENVAAGMTPEQARTAALRSFGGVEQVKEECRDAWGVRFIETLVQDLRFGLRQLRRNPGFTAVAILTLALGIGGTTAIFSLLYGAVLNPFPYADSDRLAVLVEHDIKQGRDAGWAFVSASEFLDYREQNHVFDEVIGGSGTDVVLAGTPQWFGGTPVTGNLFRVLGVPPLVGRAITPEDCKEGAPPVVVLSHKVWRSNFGGDPGIVGRTLGLNRQPTTVIGVMPPRFGWQGADVWLPATLSRSGTTQRPQPFSVVGHLKPGVTIEQANADVAVLAKRFATVYAKDHPPGMTVMVRSLTDSAIGETRKTFYIFLGAVGLLLLIACVNVANLLLARATGREREVAVRAALGATRGRLIRQFMMESWLLASGGAVLGCLLAWDGLEGLVAIIPPWMMPREAEIRINSTVLLFTLAATIFSTFLFGLAPALLAVRKDLQAPLKASGRGAGDSLHHHRLRNLLVVGEVALSLILLTGAGLLIRSFFALRHVDLGYNSDNVLWAARALPEDRYKTVEQRNMFHMESLRRARALPGVVSAALGSPAMHWAFSNPIEIAGKPSAENRSVWLRLASDGFFETMGIRLLRGRTISEEDFVQARRVAVVSRTFVTMYFGNENPLGRQIKVMESQW